jgi:hypothetical protein
MRRRRAPNSAAPTYVPSPLDLTAVSLNPSEASLARLAAQVQRVEQVSTDGLSV